MENQHLEPDMEKTRHILNYDGPITYGRGRVQIILPDDLHNWIMKNVNGKKWKRAGFIRSKLRLLMEGQLIGLTQSSIHESRRKTLDELKIEIQSKKRQKLSIAEKKELEQKEALVDINTELKLLFAKRAASKVAP